MIDPLINDDAISGKGTRQIFIDCTDTYIHGLNTGIQRVGRSIVMNAEGAGLATRLKPTAIVFYAGRYHIVSSLDDRTIHKRINSTRRKLYDLYLRCIVQTGLWLDGANSYYLSGEHPELRGAFSAPPNALTTFFSTALTSS